MKVEYGYVLVPLGSIILPDSSSAAAACSTLWEYRHVCFISQTGDRTEETSSRQVCSLVTAKITGVKAFVPSSRFDVILGSPIIVCLSHHTLEAVSVCFITLAIFGNEAKAFSAHEFLKETQGHQGRSIT